jgi:hypothetical protein
VCNSYFCNGLRDFMAIADGVTSVVVTAAGVNGETRLSPMLRNCAGGAG